MIYDELYEEEEKLNLDETGISSPIKKEMDQLEYGQQNA